MVTVRLISAVAATASAAALLTGCGSSGGAAFRTQAGVQANAASQSCLVHQKSEPTAEYHGGTAGNTTEVLTFLAYYTANGNKKFCDGKVANDKDKAWARLYASFATAKNVAGITTG